MQNPTSNTTRNFQNNISIISVSALISIPLGLIYFLYCNADDTALPMVSVLLGTFLSVFAALKAISGCKKRELYIVAVIFFAKFALTAYQAMNKNLPLGGEDWGNYHSSATALAAQYSNLFLLFKNSENDLFTNIVASIYMIFGPHTRQINLYVLASSFITARYIYKATALITDNDYIASVGSMLLFLIWPIDIVYSVTFLREIPIQMLVALSFYCYIVFIKRRKFFYLILSFAYIGLANMMHSGVLGILLVYILFMMLHEGQKVTKLFSVKNIAFAAVIIAILVVSPVWDSLTAKLGNIDTVDDIVARAQQFTEGDASTRYVTDMPESGIQLVIQIIPRALLFAVVPLPWMINSFETAISWAIDALPQLWILYRLINLIRLSKNNKKLRFYSIIALLCVAGTYMVCGIGTTAYGNAIRHRTKVFPIIAVAAVGMYYHLKHERGAYNGRDISHHSGV